MNLVTLNLALVFVFLVIESLILFRSYTVDEVLGDNFILYFHNLTGNFHSGILIGEIWNGKNDSFNFYDNILRQLSSNVISKIFIVQNNPQ